MVDFIDMHCHILPGVDDGSTNIEQTLNMLKVAYEDGTRAMIATPHYHIGRVMADRAQCQERLSQVRKKMEVMGIQMDIYLGCEIYYFSEAMDKVSEGELSSLADSSYVLIEFEPKTDYTRILGAVKTVGSEGYVPIIAHIERYNALIEKPDRCQELVDYGALLQVNGAALVGKHGRDVQKFILKQMKKRRISFVASDAHGDTKRRPRLKEAYEYVKKINEEYADQIFCHNQLRVINDRRIQVGK